MLKKINFRQIPNIRIIASVLFVLGFAAVGAIVVLRLHASTPTASVETEAGTLNCGAKVTDVTASGGSAVKFKACTFVHPGILLGKSQLDFVKAKIAAGNEPWKSAYSTMLGSHYASLSHVAKPAATLTRTTTAATDISDDAISAYTMALVYYYTGNVQYADKSISIMNAWSSTLKSVDSGAQLDAAWSSEMFPRAAEILRYTYTPASGHPALNVTAFSSMLTNVLLPMLDKNSAGATSSNGNWELSMADGTMNIGVFTNDRTVFNTGVSMWRERVPAYFYETSDGSVPVYPPGGNYSSPALVKCFWITGGLHTTTCTIPTGFAFHDGMSQETCRDIGHVVFGMEAAMYGAETAHLQNLDLYGEQQERLKDAVEFAAKYDMQALDNPKSSGTAGTVQDGICGGSLNYNGNGYKPGFEMGYRQFAGRKSISMPYTLQMLNRIRPTPSTLHMAWETLTTAGAP